MPSAGQLETLRTRFSPNVYVPYGLTELGVVSLATPETLAAAPAPASAGRIPPWAGVEVVDADGRPHPPGTTGEIRVAMEGMPEGYQKLFRPAVPIDDDARVSHRSALAFAGT